MLNRRIAEQLLHATALMCLWKTIQVKWTILCLSLKSRPRIFYCSQLLTHIFFGNITSFALISTNSHHHSSIHFHSFLTNSHYHSNYLISTHYRIPLVSLFTSLHSLPNFTYYPILLITAFHSLPHSTHYVIIIFTSPNSYS